MHYPGYFSLIFIIFYSACFLIRNVFPLLRKTSPPKFNKMRYLTILLAFGFFITSCGNNSSKGQKFIGHWKEIRPHAAKTVIISKGEEHTYKIFIPKRTAVKNDGDQHYKGFRYDPDKDVLYKGQNHKFEIRYFKDSATIRAYVNNRPQTKFMEKVKE